jgi:hypothetical protein
MFARVTSGSINCRKIAITLIDSKCTGIRIVRPFSDINHNCFGEAVLSAHSVAIPEELDEA